MRKRWILTGLLAGVLMLLLSGCLFQPADELYALPQPPEDFRNLQTQLDDVLKSGAEYAAPLRGSNTQPVQLVDLDGDGVQEVVAFFRVPTDEKPMKIYIYHQNSAQEYVLQSKIEGSGTAITAVSYEDLDGYKGSDGASDKELVVSWQISNLVYTLGAYSTRGNTVTELMLTRYTDYAISDIDQDGQKEIIVLYVDTVEDNSVAQLFDYDGAAMALNSTAPMSKEITGITSRRIGYLKGSAPALFVTSGVLSGGAVTDIFAWKDGALANVTMDKETGRSDRTYRLNTSIAAQDINGDGILELPKPTALPEYQKSGSADNFWSVLWQQYDLSGTATDVFRTYYNGDGGWYFVLPDDWKDCITISRRDVLIGERAVVFSYWTGDQNTPPQDFLTVYELTGINRESRATMKGRFILCQESDTIYCAEFTSGSWQCGLSNADVVSRFSLIEPDWAGKS